MLATFPTNETGLRLYSRSGFREVGIYLEQGQLDGRWVNVVVVDRLLGD